MIVAQRRNGGSPLGVAHKRRLADRRRGAGDPEREAVTLGAADDPDSPLPGLPLDDDGPAGNADAKAA
jgi:hypothetical protein